MAAQESSVRGGGFGSALLTMIAIVVLAGIGFSFWPKIKAAYESAPIQVQQAAPQPARIPERAPAPVYQPAPIVVQQVPQGVAPQPVQAQPVQHAAPASAVDQPAEPQPAPVVIVLHENDNHGAPVVTGSGACAVAAKGARRCGDK